MNKILLKWQAATLVLALCTTPLIFAGDYDRDGISDHLDSAPLTPNAGSMVGAETTAPIGPAQGQGVAAQNMDKSAYKQQKADLKAQHKAHKENLKNAKKNGSITKAEYKSQKKMAENAKKEQKNQMKQAYKAQKRANNYN